MTIDVEQARRDKSCYFNEGLICEKKNCARCGWNPVIMHQRYRETRRKIEDAYHGFEVIQIRRLKHESDL